MDNPVVHHIDFPGGTIVHVNWPPVIAIVILLVGVVWLIRRKRT